MMPPYWVIPAALTFWMSAWVYLGYRNGDTTIVYMRAVGAVGVAASGWVIWWLMDGVRYQ